MSFQPPPTWALPILVDEQTKRAIFNPVWLRWFLDLIKLLEDTAAGSDTSTITAAQVFSHRDLSGFPSTTFRPDSQMLAAVKAFSSHAAASLPDDSVLKNQIFGA